MRKFGWRVARRGRAAHHFIVKNNMRADILAVCCWAGVNYDMDAINRRTLEVSNSWGKQ